MTIPIRPPFPLQTALAKVRAAEDAWNSRDPVRVSLAYSTDSIWRNRDRFLSGRDQIREFLAGKWQRELDYRLTKKTLGLRRARLPGSRCGASTGVTAARASGSAALRQRDAEIQTVTA